MYVVTYERSVWNIFENQQHAVFHDVCNRRLCYVFNETEMAKKKSIFSQYWNMMLKYSAFLISLYIPYLFELAPCWALIKFLPFWVGAYSRLATN